MKTADSYASLALDCLREAARTHISHQKRAPHETADWFHARAQVWATLALAAATREPPQQVEHCDVWGEIPAGKHLGALTVQCELIANHRRAHRFTAHDGASFTWQDRTSEECPYRYEYLRGDHTWGLIRCKREAPHEVHQGDAENGGPYSWVSQPGDHKSGPGIVWTRGPEPGIGVRVAPEPAEAPFEPIRAIVEEAGGGMITLWVNRETREYPPLGAHVILSERCKAESPSNRYLCEYPSGHTGAHSRKGATPMGGSAVWENE